MFTSNADFIKHCLDYLNIPYEEPFTEIDYNQKIFIPLFKEALLECQKLVDFSGMRKELVIKLPAGSNYVFLDKDVKYFQAVIDYQTKTELPGYIYSQITSDFQEGPPTAYYFDDNTGNLYFNHRADKDYKYYVIYYKFDLTSDPHFILNEAPELLKVMFMGKLYLYVGEIDKWVGCVKYSQDLAKLQRGLEKQKEMVKTTIRINWNYTGWW